MDRHDFLSAVHSVLAPRSYVEIGVNNGRGLARSRTRTIGVDPAYRIDRELECDLKLVRASSDDFYASENALDHFPEKVADFSFIDGMHLFEFALRDFINVERTSTSTSVVVFDDMLPRSSPEAARRRHTKAWTGDVFWMIAVLERYRSDLTVIPLDTTPTGMLLVAGLDPASTVLLDHESDILAAYVKDDPQQLPHEIEYRTSAADPDKVLAAGAWQDLVAARDAGHATPASVRELAVLRGTATYVSSPPDPDTWPPRKEPAAARRDPTEQKPEPAAGTPSQVRRRVRHLAAVAKDPQRRKTAARRMWRESGERLESIGVLPRSSANIPAELERRVNPIERYFRSNNGRLIHKWLHYFDIYDRHFARFRNKPITVLEFGVSHGGSLQMWKSYFGPRARIIGVDINPKCAALAEEQIDIVIGDQGDREFLCTLRDQVGPIDVLIEDGGHSMTQQTATFEEFWPAIRDGGVFLIEDLHTSYWPEYGGGNKKPGTFIEYAKNLIDAQHAWHARAGDGLAVDEYTRSIRGMHVYDSIIVFDKAKVTKPRHERTGTRSL
jgi:cephalosporin hydroxylase